jgi:two-component system alkaline phosphatase synthesis response regulator PhoP
MKESDYKILLVDDEDDILEFVSYNLIKEGFKVYTSNNGKEGIKMAREKKPELILLDVMMPDMDGIETCEEIRKLNVEPEPIIAFLTARGEDYSQLAGFEAGADDYITKPIKPKLLISKIKALLKRSRQMEKEGPKEDGSVIKKGKLLIDREKYMVFYEGAELSLPKKEFELLALLASKPEKVFTREEIYNTIWGDNIIVGDRTIDVHIRKLREKINDKYIKTVKGVGYKFVV